MCVCVGGVCVCVVVVVGVTLVSPTAGKNDVVEARGTAVRGEEAGAASRAPPGVGG